MNESIEIFIYGCSKCSRHSAKIARAVAKRGAKVIDTKANPNGIDRHLAYLKEAGMPEDIKTSIVVENNGNIITLLSEWQ